MADVTGIAGGARYGDATENEPASDTGRHDHAHHIVDPATGAHPVLGESDAQAVHPQSNIEAGDNAGDQLFECEFAPHRQVERRNRTGEQLDRPGTTDADANQGGARRHAAEGGRYNGTDSGCELLTGRAGPGRPAVPTARKHRSLVIDECGLDLGPSDINGENVIHGCVAAHASIVWSPGIRWALLR